MARLGTPAGQGRGDASRSRWCVVLVVMLVKPLIYLVYHALYPPPSCLFSVFSLSHASKACVSVISSLIFF